jgi:P4 family phage/plasmid primase-like protien
MNEARDIFYDYKFMRNLDKNPKLIAFTNGIYDTDKKIFRAGRPDDYISKKMPIRYREFKESDEEIALVEDFLLKIFPDITVRKYFLDVVCNVFEGGNKYAKAYFWTGCGRNGKSIMQKIFEGIFGPELSIIFPTTLLTGKKALSGAPDPHLTRASGGVRWAVYEEPDKDEEIHNGRLKYFTGGDSIEVRDLFQSGKDIERFKPFFMLTGICNSIPKIRGMDNATNTRVRVIPYETVFCVDPPETFEEQFRQKRFPLDPDFEVDTLPKLLEPFAWYLLNHRKTLVGIKEPPKVLEATRQYQRQNDVYRQYIEDKIVEVKTSYLSLTEAYSDFKIWYRDSFPNSKICEKEEFKEYLLKAWGDLDRGQKWKGYRLRTPKDDELANNSEDDYKSDSDSDDDKR